MEWFGRVPEALRNVSFVLDAGEEPSWRVVNMAIPIANLDI